jgi:hypothetical protein
MKGTWAAGMLPHSSWALTYPPRVNGEINIVGTRAGASPSWY